MSSEDELMNELLEESREHFEGIEPAFLEMESKLTETPKELINQVFRAMHSIKGGFGFFGKGQIVKLAHAMENVLSLVRDGRNEITPSMVDALISGTDTLKEMIDDVDHSDSMDIRSHLAELTPFTENEETPESPPPPPHQTPTTTPIEETKPNHQEGSLNSLPEECRSKVSHYLSSGHSIFILSINEEESRKRLSEELAADAEVIFSGEWDGRPTLIIATSLQKDLIVMGLVDIEGYALFEFGVDPLPAIKKTQAPQDHGINKDSDSELEPEKEANETLRAPSKANDSIRVRTESLSRLMDTAGELILGRNRVMDVVNHPIGSMTVIQEKFNQIQEFLSSSRQTMHNEIESQDPISAKATLNREYNEIEHKMRELLGLRISDAPGIGGIFQNFSQISSNLQNGIMGTRLQPVSTVFSKFPRVLRDISRKLHKEIDLIIEGESVELDKSVIEGLGDPLTHLIRNSIDHGIELPDTREEEGKRRRGTIKLMARHEGGQVHIIIEDDGAGINTDRIRKKAVEKKMMTQQEADSLSEKEACLLIFAAGFSTAEEVSDVSGRGVGMDVVRTNIEKLGGRIEIDSVSKVGTTLTLVLPLTLAIISSIEVECCGNRYVIPQVSIEEMNRVTPSQMATHIATIGGKPVLKLRDELLPLARLDEILGITRIVDIGNGVKAVERRTNIADRRSERLDDPAPVRKRPKGQTVDRRHEGSNRIYIVVLKASNVRFGLIVDKLHSPQEVVVKPLSKRLKSIDFYAGATIRSDGNVAMILDADGLARAAHLKAGAVQKNPKEYQIANIKEAQTMLEFQCGGSERFAINLSMVSRIEEVTPDRISRSGDHEVLTYEDSSLRLMRISDHLPTTQQRPLDENRIFVLVPRLVPHPIGILIEKPLGIFETQGEVNTEQINSKGIHGTMVLEGRMIHFLNLYALFEQSAPELYLEKNTTGDFMGKKVMLAEDTALYRTVISDLLKSLGFSKVSVASDGAEALEIIQREGPFDLLVTDIVMPEMDGIQLAKELRKLDEYQDLPIVAVTSLMNDSDKKRILASGIDAYQQKLDKANLAGTMRNLLKIEEARP